MKKTKSLILIGSLCVLAFIVVFCIENNLFKDKTIPSEGDNNPSLPVVSGEQMGEENGESEENKEKTKILFTNNELAIEVLSCEMIEDTDIESQTTYAPEWFIMGELPDADYEDECIDYGAIKEVCPELKDLWEGDNYDYTEEELKEIYNRNRDVIEQYTIYKHPKTRYIFAKCRIENRHKGKNETTVDVDTFTSSENSKYLARHDNAVYFDKAIHTIGEDRDHRFFWYTFGEGEVLECTLGFEMKEEWNEKDKYYIGVQPSGVDFFTLSNTRLVPLVVGDAND